MKKEVVIAIIIGFAIGLIITFGIYRAQNAYRQQSTKQPSPTQDQTSPPLPDSNTSRSLTLISPDNESIIDQEILTITGSTNPNAFITAVTNQSQSATQADPQGNFSVDIELFAGANLITVTAVNSSGETVSADLTITFSTADLNNQNGSNNDQAL